MLEPQHNHAKSCREEFLDEVAIRLRGRLTPFESYESIDEMRGHIDAMAAAYGELGMEPVPAMEAALAKFGSPEEIGAAIAGTKPLSIPYGAAAAGLLTIAGEAVLGIVLMNLVEAFFITQNHGRVDFRMDCLIGGGLGAAIGFAASKVRMKPASFGGLLALGLNVFLFCTLYQTYIRLNKGYMNLWLELLLTPSIYVLGHSAVELNLSLKKSLRSRISQGNRPLMS